MSAPSGPLQGVINAVLAAMAADLGAKSDTELLRDRPVLCLREAFDAARDRAFTVLSLSPSGTTLLQLAVAGNAG